MAVLEIAIAIVSFIIGLIVGRFKKEWGEFLGILSKTGKLTSAIAKTMENLTVTMASIDQMIHEIRKALEDGKIDKEEAFKIINSWEKMKRALAKLEEDIKEIKSIIEE